MSRIRGFLYDYGPDIVAYSLLAIVIALFILTVVTISSVVLDREEVDTSCYHPLTPSTRIFMGVCLDEGYSFSQCYNAYVDAVEHGSVKLELPTTII